VIIQKRQEIFMGAFLSGFYQNFDVFDATSTFLLGIKRGEIVGRYTDGSLASTTVLSPR
jgi:hypothetical protein